MSVAPIKSRGTVNIPSPNQVCNISVSTATCTKSKSRHFPRKILIFFLTRTIPFSQVVAWLSGSTRVSLDQAWM